MEQQQQQEEAIAHDRGVVGVALQGRDQERGQLLMVLLLYHLLLLLKTVIMVVAAATTRQHHHPTERGGAVALNDGVIEMRLQCLHQQSRDHAHTIIIVE